MEREVMKKFIDTIKAANIKTWEAITDIPTHLYNNTEQFNLYDEELGVVYNFSRPVATATTFFTGDIIVKTADVGDIHETRIGGSYEDIKRFIDCYGFTINEDQNKILLEIYNNNYNLKPLTGDYTFHELSEKEITQLSEEEKAAYEVVLKEREKNSMTSPVQVTL